MDKPITLQIEQFKQELIRLVNESGIPIFLLDYILKDLSNEIHILSKDQLKKDETAYQDHTENP